MVEHEIYEILKELCEMPGPVSYEEAIHRFLRQRWSPRCEDVFITPVGNLVAHVGGNGPKLLLLGHGDEIGFAVKSITEDGFLFFTTGQSRSAERPEMRGGYALPTGQPALVVTRSGTVPGVFATLTGHILAQRQREHPQLEWNDLWIDVCAASRDEVLTRGIQIGDRVIWNPPTRRYGSYAQGKAMDNRVALAVMDRLLEQVVVDELAYDLYLGSSVQEEIGLVGAHSINRDIGATLAIAIDVGLSGDVPGVDQRDVSTRLGAGPILIHKDSHAYDAGLRTEILDTAEGAGVPLQHAVFALYASDAGALAREGVAAASIGIPTRYTHSAFETVHLDDLESSVRLLKSFVERPAGISSRT